MELEKEIVELKVQLGVALAIANKALDMAINSQVEAKTQVKKIEIPEPSPVVKEFIEEMKAAKESSEAPVPLTKLSPFASSMFSVSRAEARNIDKVAGVEEDAAEAMWDDAIGEDSNVLG